LTFALIVADWIAGVSLVSLTFALILELLAVSFGALLPKFRWRRIHLLPIRRLMVIVPSHNEEGSIAKCIKSIAASAGGTDDILVIAHNCDDGTGQVALGAGAMVFGLDDPALRGKGHALAKGFDLAFGEHGADAVMVLDADSTISAELIPRVRDSLSHSYVVQCRYEAISGKGRLQSRLRAFAFRCMNVVRARGRHRLGLSCGIFGNGFAVRAEVLRKVPYGAVSIVEDLEFHLALLSAGIRTEFVEDAVVSADVPPSAAGERTQSARWEGGRIRMLFSRGPSLFRQVMRGRPALVEPLIDLMALPLGIGVTMLLLLAFLPVPFFRWYAILGICVVIFHLLVAVRLSPEPGADLLALVGAPLYVVSKLAMFRDIVKAGRKRADWIRTSRLKSPREDQVR
jgi:cellulose synthase/poly-beta-1,6-N-acetylglucosamine synthase-like glycosyltransferase